jgi:hypothetical protein
LTIAPTPGRASPRGAEDHPHTRTAELAVRFGAVFAAVLAVGLALVLLTDAFGLVFVVAATLASIAASVTALRALLEGERWRLLWLPLLAFPAFVLFCAAIVFSGTAP